MWLLIVAGVAIGTAAGFWLEVRALRRRLRTARLCGGEYRGLYAAEQKQVRLTESELTASRQRAAVIAQTARAERLRSEAIDLEAEVAGLRTQLEAAKGVALEAHTAASVSDERADEWRQVAVLVINLLPLPERRPAAGEKVAAPEEWAGLVSRVDEVEDDLDGDGAEDKGLLGRLAQVEDVLAELGDGLAGRDGAGGLSRKVEDMTGVLATIARTVLGPSAEEKAQGLKARVGRLEAEDAARRQAVDECTIGHADHERRLRELEGGPRPIGGR